jgi:hypothetical protein
MSKLNIKSKTMCEAIDCYYERNYTIRNSGDQYIPGFTHGKKYHLCQTHYQQWNEELICDMVNCSNKRYQCSEMCEKHIIRKNEIWQRIHEYEPKLRTAVTELYKEYDYKYDIPKYTYK